MNEGKANLVRKVFIVITLVLAFSTLGLFLLSMNIKNVTLDYYGDIRNIKTLSNTVDGFLLQNKIYVGDNTKIEPNRETEITDGIKIVVSSSHELAKIDINEIKNNYSPVVAKIEEVIQSIPYEEETRDNPTIDRGVTNTVQQGIEGQKSTKYLVKYNRSEEIYRAELSSEVLSEAVNKIIEVGTKLTLTASRSALVSSVGATPIDEGFKQYNINLSLEEQQYAYNICKRYGIQYELFLAVMYKESGFNKYALGGGNSYGLCQIHVSNHASLRAKLGISDFYDPYDNMTAGAYLLSIYFASARKMESDTNSIEAYALNSYNMGEGVFFRNCYSQGTLHRAYSNSVIALRNSLLANGSF